MDQLRANLPSADATSRRSARPPRVRRRVAFTIVSANYIGFAATLMQSAALHLPDVERFIILSDTFRQFPDVNLSATLLGCDQMGIEHLENMKAWYTVIEFNTAIKPSVFLYFFEQFGFDEAYYIDPDILIFSPFTEVVSALRDHSCVLTPHMTDPLQDGKEPSDLTIMKSGVYNFGFFALRNDADGRRLAKWWADRCFLHCRVDIAGNLFTDQRWMDLAPVFVARPFILRHPGYNIAYWNLLHREVTKSKTGGFLVNGKPLVFFHFSGITPDKPEQFSKHQNRYTPDNLGVVNELCDLYRGLVLNNKWKQYSKEPYGFGTFSDGRRIDDTMRHWIARSVDDGYLDPKSTLAFSSNYFDLPDEGAAEKSAVLTRYMYQFWLDRKDLKAAFDIFTPSGLEAYYDWFLGGGDAGVQNVDARSIAAARKLKTGDAPTKTALPPLKSPPWPPVAHELWSKSSQEALSSGAGDIILDRGGIELRIPKLLALLWERRRDLQSAFDLQDFASTQNYLRWAMTNGVRDSGIDISCLSQEFLDSLRRTSSMSDFYGDVPITEGMLVLRGVAESRYLPGWERFPVERSGRLSHGLWFATVVPKLFGWSDHLVEPVLDYFRALSSTTVDGFKLNRMALTIWELRPDLQRTFPLGDRLSVWRYLRWLLLDGLREINLHLDEFDPRLRRFLLDDSPRYPGVSQMVEMLHDYRPDLREHFDLSSEEGRREIKEWAKLHLVPATAAVPLGEALAEPLNRAAAAVAAPVHRAAIALSGAWKAPSGLGEFVRGSANALNAVGFEDYVIIDMESEEFILPDGGILPPGAKLKVEVNIVHANADTAFENAVLFKRLGVETRKAIGFWHWELEWLPAYWRHSFSFYDEVWASTRFAQKAFSREALRPAKLVPLNVIEPHAGFEFSRSKLGLPEEATVFLFIFDFRSYATRKNPESVIKAFLAAFPNGDEPAYLLIKTSGASAMPAEAEQLRELAHDRRIEMRDVRLERSEIWSLVQASDAFVSLHRSEGFGLGPAEAMLLGVPVIVTDYSGTADYATSDCALLVDYEMVPVGEAEYPGVTGQRWADANVATAARHLRWVMENPDEARALGARGRDQIRRLYNARTVGELMLTTLGMFTEVEVC